MKTLPDNLNELGINVNIQRVLLNKKYHAVQPEDYEAKGIQPRFTFIRDDGYTLSSEMSLAQEAYSLYKDSWIKVYDVEKDKLINAKEFKLHFNKAYVEWGARNN